MKTIAHILMAISMSCVLGACGPDGGRSGGDAATTGTAADAAQPTGAVQFLGVWQYTSLSAQIACDDGTSYTDDKVSGAETFVDGTDPNQVIGTDDKGCQSVCQVAGSVATCQTGGPGCGDGTVVVSDTYTYSNGGLREDSTAQVVSPTGAQCTATGSAGLARTR